MSRSFAVEEETQTAKNLSENLGPASCATIMTSQDTGPADLSIYTISIRPGATGRSSAKLQHGQDMMWEV